MADKEFPEGIFAKEPHPKAPDFVKAAINMKREDAIRWLQSREGEWVNLQVKESRSGKWYAEVDNFKPTPRTDAAPAPEFDDDKDIPF